MSTAPIPYLTGDQYLDIEEEAEFKSEYWDGRMYAMAGGTPRHSDAAGGISAALRVRLRPRGCGVFNSDLRVRESKTGLYTYPDLAVVCSTPQYERNTLINPVLLVEVLSPSTEAGDRGSKFASYQNIEALREYVLISHQKPRVESFLRQPDQSWRYRSFAGVDAVAVFDSLELQVPLQEIYDGITFRERFA